MKEKLLEVENLTVSFNTDDGEIIAVDDVSFHIKKGEILGLVGESGCGKSVTAQSIPRLIPSPPGRINSGKIIFKGRDLFGLDNKEIRKVRGAQISMIFQEPSSALSPLHRIGHQMAENILLHSKDISRKEAWDTAGLWLKKVGISDVQERLLAFPHQLSGGMQQRVMIAMALMTNPELIIADEPTTALDVTIQSQVLDLIKEIKQSCTSILLITHDMGVTWEMCDRVIVMYASKIVEEGSLDDIFSKTAHPYTRGLLRSIPRIKDGKKRLKAIPGYVPSPLNYPKGCHFSDRCPDSFDICKEKEPELKIIEKGHRAACFLLH